jgi:hypothetical protein
MDEMRVEHVRPVAPDHAHEPAEDERVDRRTHPQPLHLDALGLEPVCELRSARLALVEHHEPHVMAALAKGGKEQ